MKEHEDHSGARKTAPNRSPHIKRSLAPMYSLAFNAVVGLRGLAHNHPSRDPMPSQANIQMTKVIVDIATPLGISVHDHIIVGKRGHASLKGMRLI
jgi:DNA repair protein RadC